MSTAEIKDALIEKIKGMNKKEAELFYGKIIEERNFSDKDFFEKWEDVPEAHKKSIESGLKDLQQGKSRSFNNFAASFKRKHPFVPAINK